MEVDALVFLVNRTHQLRCRWQYLVNENEDRFLWGKLDTFPYHVDELPHCQVLHTGNESKG